MLCSNCSEIFHGNRKVINLVSEDIENSDEESEISHYPHYLTLGALLQSADNGCHICLIISNMFSRDESGRLLLGANHIKETDGPIQYTLERMIGRPPDTQGDYSVIFEGQSFSAVIDLFRIENGHGKMHQFPIGENDVCLTNASARATRV